MVEKKKERTKGLSTSLYVLTGVATRRVSSEGRHIAFSDTPYVY